MEDNLKEVPAGTIPKKVVKNRISHRMNFTITPAAAECLERLQKGTASRIVSEAILQFFKTEVEKRGEKLIFDQNAVVNFCQDLRRKTPRQQHFARITLDKVIEAAKRGEFDPKIPVHIINSED